MTTEMKLWQGWASRHVDTENPIPLFETDESLIVQHKNYGQNDRKILKRSKEMETSLRNEGRKVIEDWSATDDTYDGLIYLMYWLIDGQIIPLYIGKAGKYGRDGESLSGNLEGLQRSSTRKFARWGDGHYYHIGDLSAIVCDHDKNQKPKYRTWTDLLFEEGRQLRRETYFWTKAWGQENVGLYHNPGVPLKQFEDQLISLTAELYPDRLLNIIGA